MTILLFLLLVPTFFSGYICESNQNDIPTTLTGLECECPIFEDVLKEMNGSTSDVDTNTGSTQREASVLVCLVISVMVITVVIILTVFMIVRRRIFSKMYTENVEHHFAFHGPETNMLDNTEKCKGSDHISAHQETVPNAAAKRTQDTIQPPDKNDTQCSVRNIKTPYISKVDENAQERVMCKICLSRKMCVVFMPCNHMVACASCSDMLDRCAVCRTVIKGTLNVYTEF